MSLSNQLLSVRISVHFMMSVASPLKGACREPFTGKGTGGVNHEDVTLPTALEAWWVGDVDVRT